MDKIISHTHLPRRKLLWLSIYALGLGIIPSSLGALVPKSFKVKRTENLFVFSNLMKRTPEIERTSIRWQKALSKQTLLKILNEIRFRVLACEKCLDRDNVAEWIAADYQFENCVRIQNLHVSKTEVALILVTVEPGLMVEVADT